MAAPGTPCASNGRLPQRRFSTSRRSSSALAIPPLGPMRIHVLPPSRTGGLSEGWTSMTSTVQLAIVRRSTNILGNGSNFPSSRQFATFSMSASSTMILAHAPSSSWPIITKPDFLWPGKSLAKAQIACLISSAFSALRFRSTRSDSRLEKIPANAESEIIVEFCLLILCVRLFLAGRGDDTKNIRLA